MIVPQSGVPLDTLHAVETPEGIALALRPAGVVPRALAYLIDLMIRIGMYSFVGVFLMMLIGLLRGSGGGLFVAVYLIGLFALEWFYPVFFELMPRGATPGKRAMGLQVVMDSGLPVTPVASLLRNLLRVADLMPGAYAVGIAAMLMRADFKRLGDMAAGTLVVYADSVQLNGKLPAAAPAAPVRMLTAREQLAIISWAERAERLTPERFNELALLAASVCAPPLHAADTRDAGERLLGVANWLSGRRAEAPP